MRLLVATVILLGGCAVGTMTLRQSSYHCKYGTCSQTPVLMMVIGENAMRSGVNNAAVDRSFLLSGFTFVGWTRYDGRIQTLGKKYLAFMDDNQNVVCEGYYDWAGFSRISDVELRCFDNRELVTGQIRNNGRQPSGVYSGKGIGTGFFKFNGGIIAVIYGVDPFDLKAMKFKELWKQHGGDPDEIPLKKIPERKTIIPLLNRRRQIET